MLDEPTGSYRERIATQARPGRGRWSMVGYAACAVLVLNTLVMGVNSIGSYEKDQRASGGGLFDRRKLHTK